MAVTYVHYQNQKMHFFWMAVQLDSFEIIEKEIKGDKRYAKLLLWKHQMHSEAFCKCFAHLSPAFQNPFFFSPNQ